MTEEIEDVEFLEKKKMYCVKKWKAGFASNRALVFFQTYFVHLIELKKGLK